MSYKPLRNYGLIGDMHTAALVGRDGSIDWCCFPRFDAPAAFAALLDAERGGKWSVTPIGLEPSGQRYEDGTNVLVTAFEGGNARLEVIDFMPVLEADPTAPAPREIHRCLRASGSEVEVEIRFQPRFDYGRSRSRFRLRRHGVLATDGEDEALTVSTDAGVEWEVDAADGQARTRISVPEGRPSWLVLRYDDDEVWPVETYGSEARLASTRAYWREWSLALRYHGKYGALVERSALVLKLLIYAPTGAVVAAPTTSLPEVIGGERNWDYRYSWLRDSTYTLFALHALGKFGELDRYLRFLKKVCRQDSEFLQIMYGVGGELCLPEEELGHLEGYRRSAPVRIGNAAVDQLQLDVYGEVLDSVHIWRKHFPMTEGMWDLCVRLANWVADNWQRPDQGVWEMRGPPRRFVFSKLMCWVALDRGLRAAEELGLEAPLEEWRTERERIRAEILTRGWNEARRTFVQHYETDRTDAANLVMPLVRFLPPDDPRVLATVERVREELVHAPSGLVYRYRSPDGLPGEEGAFCINTFQLAQVLAMAGRVGEADEVFESAIRHASPLGLLSEEIDPNTGELLGNFPQAFSHIGLINAAHVIARARPDQTATFALLPEE